MKYCSSCGNPVIEKIPEGDNRSRFVCLGCGVVHYSNPNIITGCLAVYKKQVLLCKRAISPQKGFWALPAGFMENNETAAQGAVRETWEEARAKVAIDGIYALYDIPHISQLYIIHRAVMRENTFSAGQESLDAALFDEQDIPWDELAFPIFRDVLEHYFDDRKNGDFPVRSKICLDIIDDD